MAFLLRTSVTKVPDLDSLDYYLQAGDEFNIEHFAHLHSVGLQEFDAAGVDAAIARAARLLDGQWMKVELETA